MDVGVGVVKDECTISKSPASCGAGVFKFLSSIPSRTAETLQNLYWANDDISPALPLLRWKRVTRVNASWLNHTLIAVPSSLPCTLGIIYSTQCTAQLVTNPAPSRDL